MTRRLWMALVSSILTGVVSLEAQDTTGAGRAFILEGRLGIMGAMGGTSRMLIGSRSPDMAGGATLAFEITKRTWGWVSVDYKPRDESGLYGPTLEYSDTPPIGLYALTGGISRTFGLPIVPARWKPFELGMGLGATQTEIWPGRLSTQSSPPPGAEVERLANGQLLAYRRWRPAAAGRLRVAVPIGPLRFSATTGILATYVGNVRLWDGGWEQVGEGNTYRPTARVWRLGTVVAVPMTVGLGVEF